MSAGARRGTILIVPILLLLAGVVILVGVVSVAVGRGGEMAEFATDSLPPRVDDIVTAADVATLRLPSALWGYNVQVTDEALSRAAQVITERDGEIAQLRRQLSELRAVTGSHPAIAATLRARSKARTEASGLDKPPAGAPDTRAAEDARAAEARAPEPGPAETGPARTGSAGTGSADTGSADTESVDTRSVDMEPADSGSAGSELAGSELPAPVSGEAAASRDD
jgi:hypothetical protein